jgi:hypothetical protein
MAQVTIRQGQYRNFTIANKTMRLVQGYTEGAKGGFVKVANDGMFPNCPAEVKVKVSFSDIEVVQGDNIVECAAEPEVFIEETEEQAIERIRERFQILEEMTEGAREGTVKAMIVSGPPGVGKSFGVEKVLEQASFFDRLGQRGVRYEVIKGATSAIGLYCKLYSYSDPNSVLVFDDCDSILLDDISLNVLKAALDSNDKRTISWNTDAAMLRREGVPDRFDFKGSVIFITNLKFDNIRSAKLKDHLSALESRCHYLDLTMDSTRDKFIRIKQIVKDGMLDKYEFSEEQKQEVMSFVIDNAANLREVSLRTVLKVADLVKMKPTGWKRLAETTVMKR